MSGRRIAIAVAVVMAGLALAAGGRAAYAQEDEPAQMEGAGAAAGDDAADSIPGEVPDAADAPVPMTPRRSDVLIATPPQAPQPPRLGDIHWIGSEAHCRFLREGQAENPEDPESWRYLLLIERFHDGQVTLERGYARIDGLVRELALLTREASGDGEIRRYETLGEAPVSLTVTMKLLGRTRAVTRYSGEITLERDGLSTSGKFDGTCAPDAANLRAKS
ncbi:MAG: hypothetical protein K8H74_12670 [Notoacmeibacter sp.]|nr:hypothetical protein [Notoacmeibacter sp.]